FVPELSGPALSSFLAPSGLMPRAVTPLALSLSIFSSSFLSLYNSLLPSLPAPSIFQYPDRSWSSFCFGNPRLHKHFGRHKHAGIRRDIRHAKLRKRGDGGCRHN